ncbi:Helicase [Quillaja saponaria]|uniref:Helicase n=2 Tax=Quillaja saponaria TaxID=32244 RepID=A0AAD7Q9K4_QUISA|nr:Helicase [Quillaja saponaria]
MVLKICLMASHGYPSGLVLQQEQGLCRVLKDCQPLLPSPVAIPGMMRCGPLNPRPNMCQESLKSESGWLSNQFVKIDPVVHRPVLIDVQETHPDSVLFSFGIAEQCTRHDKILQFLMSGTSETDSGGFDISWMPDLMGLQPLTNDLDKPFATSFIYPNCKSVQKPFLDFVGDLGCNSNVIVHPDGQALFMGSGAEMKDLLSVVAEFYVSKNSLKWRKKTVLIPHYPRLNINEAGTEVLLSSFNVQATTIAPLKSPEKIKVKPSPKKNRKKLGRERDLYKKNYFHACESLLSLMVDKKQRRKTAILSLMKSGPELPELLTQFSVGIAGTGLAVLFSVAYKVASGRVPFCSSKLFNTGFGFGLFWLSWAVNKMRDTIIYISKNGGKFGLKDEETMRRLDKSMGEIYFRAAALLAVALMRLA